MIEEIAYAEARFLNAPPMQFPMYVNFFTGPTTTEVEVRTTLPILDFSCFCNETGAPIYGHQQGKTLLRLNVQRSRAYRLTVWVKGVGYALGPVTLHVLENNDVAEEDIDD